MNTFYHEYLKPVALRAGRYYLYILGFFSGSIGVVAMLDWCGDSLTLRAFVSLAGYAALASAIVHWWVLLKATVFKRSIIREANERMPEAKALLRRIYDRSNDPIYGDTLRANELDQTLKYYIEDFREGYFSSPRPFGDFITALTIVEKVVWNPMTFIWDKEGGTTITFLKDVQVSQVDRGEHGMIDQVRGLFVSVIALEGLIIVRDIDGTHEFTDAEDFELNYLKAEE